MAVWVADTSILIDHIRGRPEARDAVTSRMADDGEVWSVVTVRTERVAGARPEDGPSVSEVLRTVAWLDGDRDLADLAGRMARHYRRSYPGIGLLDYLVAAVTQALGANLLTLNAKHFSMFPDLLLPYD
jgi:predicted nucleic acid-binding protein